MFTICVFFAVSALSLGKYYYDIMGFIIFAHASFPY
ncbi:hypothetical protein SAMN05216324_101306 [Chryseobacterium limigenitum]|uniref:Uncharacterized protein n=1 Tax=Chryseobacterium limigenitum TaxID=1612149 RepID=A0A1K2IF28_9FLAO|nr:hypothetical protein SAMN05216324_101306 [Chryseobacterium limigenitum]